MQRANLIRPTGTAVYLYSIQPLGLPLVDTTPTAMNLTFNLDNNTRDTFLHQGSDAATGYVPGVNVYSKTGLTETPHVLRVELGPNTVFLFDYMIYTRSNPSNPTTPLAQDIPNPSQSVSPYVRSRLILGKSASPISLFLASPLQHGVIEANHLTLIRSTKRHNIATFAGAVGGSVGVLALVSLGLAFSIIKRRRNYERRERLNQRELLHTDASDDSPPEAGPAPFVPRFFPGTHVPADPPPYVESLSTSSTSDASHPALPSMVSSSVIPASYNAHLARSLDRSYADVPPSSPPPPLDDILPPPPPFALAINPRPPGELMGVTQSHGTVVAAGEAEELHDSGILATDPVLPVPPMRSSTPRRSQDSPS